MNILYLHGLNGRLTQEKREILERFGNVHAPTIDYESKTDRIVWLQSKYKTSNIDVVIGSSMGGFAGYHLAKLLEVPALVFNPALVKRKVLQDIPKSPETNGSFIKIILGSMDPVVNPQETLNFLGHLLIYPQNYKIIIRHDLEHRIPIDVFEVETEQFFKDL